MSNVINLVDDAAVASDDAGAFRLSAKRLFCTYSQVPHDWSHEQVLGAFREAISPYLVEQWVVGRETHKDGGVHYHVYAALDRKANIRSATRLDLTINEDTVHGNYKTGRLAHIKYAQKEDNYITNIKGKGLYIALAKEGKFLESEEDFSRAHPKEYVLHLQSVRTNLQTLGQKDCSANRVYQGPFKKTWWTALNGWNRTTKTLFVTGASGSGKTQLALNMSTYPLVVTHLDGLKGLKRMNDLIVFDDMNFRRLPRVTNIHLVDIEVTRQINVKHGCVWIEAGMPRVITTNESFDEFFADDPYGAIARRVYIIDMDSL